CHPVTPSPRHPVIPSPRHLCPPTSSVRYDKRMAPLEVRLKQRARELGFELVGIAPATPADGFERLRAWLERGYAGEMTYMHRHAAARRDPSSVLAEVRSVVMVGMNYLASGGRQPPDAAYHDAAYHDAAYQ